MTGENICRFLVDTNRFIAAVKKMESSDSINRIDIVFVTYGQLGKNDYFGLDKGICLEKDPYCNSCGIKEYCEYYAN